MRLRGRYRERGVAFTKLAEPYPRALCECLAAAVMRDLRITSLPRRKLDITRCARCLGGRIGEAINQDLTILEPEMCGWLTSHSLNLPQWPCGNAFGKVFADGLADLFLALW